MTVFALMSAAAADATAADRKPQAWAILIGINDYADLEDLQYASQDVQALGKKLGGAGFAESHLFLLHDQASDAKFKPLKANIERQLGLLAKVAAKDDLLVVAFSGHGMHLDGKTYLCPTEAQVDNPDATMVPLDWVYQQLEKCPAALRLILVDACRNDPRPKGKKSATPKDDLSSLGKSFERPPDGIVVLASCAPGQISYEEQEFGHGVFMHQLLKGLGGAADSNKNGKVSLGELYEFTASETKTFVARARSDYQSPQLFGRIDGVFEFERSGHTPGETIQNSLGMKLVFLPAGQFVMGSPRSEAERQEDEPHHTVRISRPLFLGAHEVTRGQFAEFVKDAGYRTDAERAGTGGYGVNETTLMEEGPDPKYTWKSLGFRQTDTHPAVNISWNDAQEFCRYLSANEARKYRLPTEAEWEYACRAGTATAFQSGGNPEGLATIGNVGDAAYASRKTDAKGWAIAANDGYVFTSPVGTYKPNALGLFDMTGNVWEWCSDWYDKSYYLTSPAEDPTGPPEGSFRVIRGGGWNFPSRYCRSAERHGNIPSGGNYGIGFRVVLEP